MKDFRERFNPHCECIYSVVDFVYYFFYNNYANLHAIQRCRTLKDVYWFFEKSSIHIICKCHPIFFLNPISYYLCIMSYIKNKNARPGGKIAVITFSSALELYGINDLWTHYVCEIMENGKHYIYDPYRKFIQKDYPIIQNTILDIKESKKFQFILWR